MCAYKTGRTARKKGWPSRQGNNINKPRARSVRKGSFYGVFRAGPFFLLVVVEPFGNSY